jgi:hypothetical protein
VEDTIRLLVAWGFWAFEVALDGVSNIGVFSALLDWMGLYVYQESDQQSQQQ